jgi:hypothetical protein
MRRVLLIVVALVLVGGGFAAGWLAARPHQSDDPWKDAPDGSEWHYPGGAVQGSSKGGKFLADGVRVGPQYTTVLTTSDDVPKVLAYYAAKLNAPQVAGADGGSGFSHFDTEAALKVVQGAVLQDNTQPPGAGQPKAGQLRATRPVRVGVINVCTERYDLCLFISRAEGEEHTHIVVAYGPQP